MAPTPAFVHGKFHGQKSLAATIHGVAKSQTQLSMHAHTLVKFIESKSGMVVARGK